MYVERNVFKFRRTCFTIDFSLVTFGFFTTLPRRKESKIIVCEREQCSAERAICVHPVGKVMKTYDETNACAILLYIAMYEHDILHYISI